MSIFTPRQSYSFVCRGLIIGLLLTECFVITLQAQGAEDMIYRCQDGSFTNRLDPGCTLYHSQGFVTLSPDGQPPAIIRDRVKGNTSTITAVLPPPSGKGSKAGYTLCGIYDEWQALRRATSGGTIFRHGRDVARWQALSRIFLSVGPPQCEILPVVQSAQASSR